MSTLIAIDPATKKMGVALFRDGVLEDTATLESRGSDRQGRQQEIITKLQDWLIGHNILDNFTVVCEDPLLRGKANNTLQRFIGALEGFFTPFYIEYIPPKTVKAAMGSGDLDKLSVALSAGERVNTDWEKNRLALLIDEERWDETDAVAIGLTYMRDNPNA